jgi:hypothetical protein
MSDTSNLPGLARRAIDQIGGSAYLARILGLPKTTVQSWKGSRIPDVYAIRVARTCRVSTLRGPAGRIRPGRCYPCSSYPILPRYTDVDADMVGSVPVVGPSS